MGKCIIAKLTPPKSCSLKLNDTSVCFSTTLRTLGSSACMHTFVWYIDLYRTLIASAMTCALFVSFCMETGAMELLPLVPHRHLHAISPFVLSAAAKINSPPRTTMLNEGIAVACGCKMVREESVRPLTMFLKTCKSYPTIPAAADFGPHRTEHPRVQTSAAASVVTVIFLACSPKPIVDGCRCRLVCLFVYVSMLMIDVDGGYDVIPQQSPSRYEHDHNAQRHFLKGTKRKRKARKVF